jgi:hypothetical protein
LQAAFQANGSETEEGERCEPVKNPDLWVVLSGVGDPGRAKMAAKRDKTIPITSHFYTKHKAEKRRYGAPLPGDRKISQPVRGCQFAAGWQGSLAYNLKFAAHDFARNLVSVTEKDVYELRECGQKDFQGDGPASQAG